MKKVIYELVGLSCASCADKIEKKLKQANFLNEVDLSFITKTLSVKFSGDASKAQIRYEIQKIVGQIERNIIVRENVKLHKNKENKKDQKNKAVLICVSMLLFIVALFVKVPLLSNIFVFASFAFSGAQVILSALKSVIRRKPFDEALLMTIATVGALIIGKFAEAATVMLFYQIGEFFQEYATTRSRQSISELMDIRPDYANLKSVNEIIRVSPLDVKPGDVIIIKPGEKIPVDARVISGESSIDTSSLTGEALSTDVAPGDELISGCINTDGYLEAEATSGYCESTVAKIIDLIENAGNKKAKSERFITRFSRLYTPMVTLSALMIALVPPLLIDISSLGEWVYRALIFLVVSCPCALVLSVPLAFFSGIGGASRSGVLVKGASALEVLEKVQYVAFDKTGTLTNGVFTVSSVSAVNADKKTLLEYAVTAESLSNHPVAQSIVKAFPDKADPSRINNIIEVSGRGIIAEIDGKDVFVGNSKLMRNNNIVAPVVQTAGTIVHIAVAGKYWGYIEIMDEIKEHLNVMITELRALGISKTVMLTGDRKQAGEYVARRIGIDDAFCELLPVDKVNYVESLISSAELGKKTAFVGDGINDAPVLARADVGITMGGLGADCAIEAADVIIMSDDPAKICTAIKIAKNTMSIVRQNIVFALGIKALVLMLAVFGQTSMWAAVFADVGVSLIAVFNSLRTLKKID